MTDHSDWEFFQDEGYFGMWCVRENGVRRFGEGFHTVSKEEAEALASALSSQSLSLSEAREEIERLKGLVAGIRECPQEHFDDIAVGRFADAMKAKLAKKRAEGRGGWEDKQDCSNAFLSRLLREHIDKGDPVDVGNLAMMIHQRDERVG